MGVDLAIVLGHQLSADDVRKLPDRVFASAAMREAAEARHRSSWACRGAWCCTRPSRELPSLESTLATRAVRRMASDGAAS